MSESEYKITLDEFRAKFGDSSGYVEYVGCRAFSLLRAKF